MHKALSIGLPVLFAAQAAVGTTTIVATPTPANNVPSFNHSPTFTIVYDDYNLNGLFEISELLSFSAPQTSNGQGSSFHTSKYLALYSAPDVSGVSSSSVLSPPLNSVEAEFCQQQQRWCMFEEATYLGQPPTQRLSGQFRTSFTYAVSVVPEPTAGLMYLFGLALLGLYSASRTWALNGGKFRRGELRHYRCG